MIWYLSVFCQNYFLRQHVLESTHKDGNILDLVFTNNTKIVHNISCSETLLSISHHKILEVTSLFCSSYVKANTFTKTFNTSFDSLNFFSDKTDWTSISTRLSQIDWDSQLENLSVNQMYESFYNICEKI